MYHKISVNFVVVSPLVRETSDSVQPREQIKGVYGLIGCVTSSTASACSLNFTAMARDLNFPPHHAHPLVDVQQSTLDWDPRLGEDG